MNSGGSSTSRPSAASSDTVRVGWIGLGVMGASMAGRLLAAGYRLTVHTRTKAKANPLLERGAAWADTPREVALASEIVFSIVGYPTDVEQTYLDPQTGVLTSASASAGGSAPGTGLAIVVDMTTSSPALAQRIAIRAAECGVAALDAPVSGGDIGARNGTLSIMVGASDAAAVERVRPLFAHLGKTVTHLGGPGAGQHTKMVNQMLIATTMVGVCEGLLYARKAGLDPLQVIEAVGGGAAGSWTISNLGPRMVQRNFEPGFYVEHFLKDMGIALAEARRMRLAVPGLALAEQLYEAVRAQGLERKGTHALLLALERLSGMAQEDPPTADGPAKS